MTTARQVKKLVAPLLARQADLALSGRLVVLRPVHHILCGMLIGRTVSAEQCQPRWLVTYLFVRRTHLPVGRGELIHRPAGHWRWSNPDLSKDLIEVVEQDVLPQLRTLATIHSFFEFALPSNPDELAYYRAMEARFLIALGELDEARDIIKNQEQASNFWVPHLERIGLKEKLFDLGDRLDAEDRTKLANLLHEWEAYTVDKLKLRSVWERTPFPLEEARE